MHFIVVCLIPLCPPVVCCTPPFFLICSTWFYLVLVHHQAVLYFRRPRDEKFKRSHVAIPQPHFHKKFIMIRPSWSWRLIIFLVPPPTASPSKVFPTSFSRLSARAQHKRAGQPLASLLQRPRCSLIIQATVSYHSKQSNSPLKPAAFHLAIKCPLPVHRPVILNSLIF